MIFDFLYIKLFADLVSNNSSNYILKLFLFELVKTVGWFIKLQYWL